MGLETMSANLSENTASREVVETFAAQADELTIRVWGGDWCGDCQDLLPAFAAALDSAGVPEDNIEEYALDREKEGKLVEAYDVEYIPTIVVERDDHEVARFVESEPKPPAVFLAERLETTE